MPDYRNQYEQALLAQLNNPYYQQQGDILGQLTQPRPAGWQDVAYPLLQSLTHFGRAFSSGPGAQRGYERAMQTIPQQQAIWEQGANQRYQAPMLGQLERLEGGQRAKQRQLEILNLLHQLEQLNQKEKTDREKWDEALGYYKETDFMPENVFEWGPFGGRGRAQSLKDRMPPNLSAELHEEYLKQQDKYGLRRNRFYGDPRNVIQQWDPLMGSVKTPVGDYPEPPPDISSIWRRRFEPYMAAYRQEWPEYFGSPNAVDSILQAAEAYEMPGAHMRMPDTQTLPPGPTAPTPMVPQTITPQMDELGRRTYPDDWDTLDNDAKQFLLQDLIKNAQNRP